MKYPLRVCRPSTIDGRVRIADAEHRVIMELQPGFEYAAADIVSSLNSRSRSLRASYSRLGIAQVVTFLARRLGGALSASPRVVGRPPTVPHSNSQ